MNIFRAIINNTSSQIISRVVSSGTGFVVTLLIARNFGINGYSDIAKITALTGIFYLGIDLGANAVFLQFEKQEQNFQHLLYFRLLMACVVLCLLGITLLFFPFNPATTIGYSPFVKAGILLFSLSFFTRAIVYSCSAMFQQQLEYVQATKATAFSSAITLSTVVVVIIFHLSIMWVIGAYLLGGIGEAIISLTLLKRKIKLSLPSFVFFRKIFFATLPLTMLLFLNLLYFRIDMVILALFQKSVAVGIYDYAYKFFDFLIALPLFLSNSLYPLLLVEEKNSRIQKKKIGLYAGLFFVAGLVLVPLVWIFAPLIALVKVDFSLSILPLRLLSLSLPTFFATNILQWIFITKKKQALLVWVYGLSLVLNIVLNLIFIPQGSYVAAAIITGFSELLILFIMVIALLCNLI